MGPIWLSPQYDGSIIFILSKTHIIAGLPSSQIAQAQKIKEFSLASQESIDYPTLKRRPFPLMSSSPSAEGHGETAFNLNDGYFCAIQPRTFRVGRLRSYFLHFALHT